MITPTTLGYDDSKLKQLRIICIAIAVAGTAICVAAIFVGQGNEDAAQQEAMDSLRYVHLILAVFTIFSSRLVGEKMLSGKLTQPSMPPQPFFQRYQSSAIVQLAAIEGLTLFGAVIIMLTPAAIVEADPNYYLHLAPVVLLLFRALQLYPTQDKLEMLARRYQN